MKNIYTVLFALFFCTPLFAVNQIVTTTSFNVTGSLSYAVYQATNGDTIFFASNLAGQTLTLTSQLSINKDIVIQGLETGNTVTLSGGNTNRVFSIQSSRDVTINRVNFTGGMSNEGGAILNSGELELNYCRFYGNTANVLGNNNGGGAVAVGIFAIFRSNNCEFYNNTVNNVSTFVGVSIARGGAIINKGTSTISNCSFYDNLVENDNAISTSRWAEGGAIANPEAFPEGTLEINSSTFSNNKAESLAENGIARGGAIFNEDTMTMSHCTVLGNVADGTIERGGNIYSVKNTAFFTLYNTIIAKGEAENAPDLFTLWNSVVSLGNNIIEDTVEARITYISGDMLADPSLDDLAYNNGAFTKTHALIGCSPAYNAGNNANAPGQDQAGQNRIFGGTIDIGAFEAQAVIPTAPTISVSVQNDTICQGEETALSATLSGTGTYLWDSGLGAGQSPIVSPSETTLYTVVATETSSGCTATDSISLAVNPLPDVPVISETGQDLTTGVYSSYQWYLNGSILISETAQTITPTQTGNYTVSVSGPMGCFNISAAYNFILSGIWERADVSISLYPNPTADVLNFENEVGSGSVLILNALGQVISNNALSNGSNRLDVSDLPSGYYMLRFTKENQVYSGSFIKE